MSAVNDDGRRYAVPVRQQAALDAAFAAIRRIGPGFFPPKGALVIAPSRDNQDQSISCNVTAWSMPRSQNSSNTPACAHSRKRRCAELPEQSRCLSRHSIGNRYAARTELPSWLPGRSPVGYGTPKDAAGAVVKAVPFVPGIVMHLAHHCLLPVFTPRHRAVSWTTWPTKRIRGGDTTRLLHQNESAISTAFTVTLQHAAL